MTSPAHNSKEALRQTAYRKRLNLPAAAQKQAAKAMMEKFLQEIPLNSGCIIAAYWPVHAEINVMPLLMHLLKQGHPCALPQIAGKGAALVFRRWHEKTPMRLNAYEIREPDPAASPAVTPDILIVPLLAFDAEGHRLGYGAGFYDRTLPALKARGCTVVGVAYDVQKIGKIPAEGHDCKMDMIITDRQVYRFS